MLIDNERQLRTWLEWRLAPICDADPKALAKYVLALTKKDKSDDDLQSLCIDQLEVFIQGETVKFVSDLFQTLNSKEYVNFDLKAVEEKEKATKQAQISAVITKKENLEDNDENNKWLDNNNGDEGLKGYTDDESTIGKGHQNENNDAIDDPEQTALDPEIDLKKETRRLEDKPKYKDEKDYRDSKYKEKTSHKSHRDYGRDRDYRHRSRSRSPRDLKYKRDRSRSPKYNRRSPDREYTRHSGRRNKEELKKELERQKSAHDREIRELKEKNERYKSERDRKEREQFKRLETQRLIEKEIAIQKAERMERKERKEKQESIKREIALQRQIEVYKLSRAREKERERDHKKDKSFKLLTAELKKRDRSKSPKKTKKDKSRSRSPSKKACPDFYEKGICTRGDNCKYEHTGAIVTIDNDYALVAGNSNINVALSSDNLTNPTVVQSQVQTTGTVPMSSLTPPVLPNTPVQVPSTNVVSQLPNLSNITPLPPISGNNIFPPTNIYDPNLPSLSGLPPLPIPPPGTDPHNAAASAAMAVLVANQFPQLDLQGAQDRIRQFSTNRTTHFRNSFTSPPSKIGEPDPTKLHVVHIPEHLNNITKLNEHFSKFGPIINIQVQIEKASASVEFSTEDACNAALNSPEPVLNNRFIQIRQFINRSTYHNPRGSFRGRVARGRPPVSVHERLGNKSEIIQEVIESKESIALKQKSQDRIKIARDAIKFYQVQQLESAKRAKQTLLQQQKELLEKQITQQKRLVEKLQDPNTQMAEKGGLLQTLKALASNTDEMRTRVKTLETEIEDDKERTKVEKEVEDLEKLLLSMSASGQDTQQIRLQLYRLQDKAHRLGIYSRKRKLSAQHERGRGRGRGGRGRGRGMALSQKMAQKSNEYMAAGAIVDRRPRKLRVSGYADNELNDVIVHLADIGEVEYLETIEDDICIVVQYKTRADAELAATRGQFLKNKKLIVVWQKSNEDAGMVLNCPTTNAANDIKEIEEELAKELGQSNILYDSTPPRRHKKKHKQSESQIEEDSFLVEINLPNDDTVLEAKEENTSDGKVDFKPTLNDDDLLDDDNDLMSQELDDSVGKVNGFPVITKSITNDTMIDKSPTKPITEITVNNIPVEEKETEQIIENEEPPIKKSRGDSDDDLLYSDEEENKTKEIVEPVKIEKEHTTSDDLLLDEDII